MTDQNFFRNRRRGVKPYKRSATVYNTEEILARLGTSCVVEAEVLLKEKGVRYHRDALGELWSSQETW